MASQGLLASSTTKLRGASSDAGHCRFFPETRKRQHRSDAERGGSETPTLDFLLFWPLMHPPKKIRKAHMADTAAGVVELLEGSELCFQDLFKHLLCWQRPSREAHRSALDRLGSLQYGRQLRVEYDRGRADSAGGWTLLSISWQSCTWTLPGRRSVV